LSSNRRADDQETPRPLWNPKVDGRVDRNLSLKYRAYHPKLSRAFIFDDCCWYISYLPPCGCTDEQ